MSERKLPLFVKISRAKGKEKIKKIGLRVGLAIFILIFGWLLFRGLWQYAATLPQYQLSPATAKVTRAPSWLKEDFAKEVARPSGLEENFSLLESGISQRLADSFSRNPWVRKVKFVERDFSGKVRIGLILRQPVAIVRKGVEFYLVDIDGRRLPGMWLKRRAVGLDLPLIINMEKGAPEVGEIWPGKDVCHGAAVAHCLTSFDLSQVNITAIDVANVGGRFSPYQREIVLLTDKGTRILWGRAPHSSSPGELTPATKIALLLGVVSKEGGLDHLEYVDISIHPPVKKLRAAFPYQTLDFTLSE
ncbi:MAG: hypothetical protein AMS15_09385 [Planctomycetes bacterium DG_23]|nr:MAG: hypothetical protein AMS15_09385 [Planctomycetes bacterium DG_23]